MTEEKELCPQRFKVWLAFLMGMVLIVIAIVVFDKVLRDGRLGIFEGRRDEDISARPTTAPANATAGGTAQSVSYLTLKGNSDSESWLGIEAVDLTESTARMLGYDFSGGVVIGKVFDDSPAEKADLRSGDILVQFNYRNIDSVDALSKLLSGLDPDTRVKVVFYRDGEREVAYVKLGEASAAPGETEQQVAESGASSNQRWGIVVSELSEALRKAYDIPNKEKGVVVLMVVAGSAADRSGIKRGDLIEQVDRTSVKSLSDFFQAIQTPANHVLLKVYRNDTVLFVHVNSVNPLVPVGGLTYTDDADLNVKETGRPLSTPSPNRPDIIASQDTQSSTGTQKSTGSRQSLLGIPTEIFPEPIVTIVSGLIDDDDDEEAPVCKRVQDLEAVL